MSYYALTLKATDTNDEGYFIAEQGFDRIVAISPSKQDLEHIKSTFSIQDFVLVYPDITCEAAESVVDGIPEDTEDEDYCYTSLCDLTPAQVNALSWAAPELSWNKVDYYPRGRDSFMSIIEVVDPRV
jgi:hypothetical protein